MFEKTPPISDEQLDRYLSGELSSAEAAALRRVLARDPEATARLAALRAARGGEEQARSWLVGGKPADEGADAARGPGVDWPEPSAEDFARAAEDLAEPVVPGTWRRAIGAMIAGGAAISLVAIIPGASENGPGMRTSGATGPSGGLELLLLRGEQSVAAPARIQVQDGDLLQPVLTADQARQVAVLAEDADRISPWLHDGGRTVTVPAGAAVELADTLPVGSVFEGTLHGFVCDAPTSVEALSGRVRGGPRVEGCREARWVVVR